MSSVSLLVSVCGVSVLVCLCLNRVCSNDFYRTKILSIFQLCYDFGVCMLRTRDIFYERYLARCRSKKYALKLSYFCTLMVEWHGISSLKTFAWQFGFRVTSGVSVFALKTTGIPRHLECSRYKFSPICENFRCLAKTNHTLFTVENEEKYDIIVFENFNRISFLAEMNKCLRPKFWP